MIGISRLYCGVAEDSDALRYRRRSQAERRPVIVWNCTRRCNLRCAHCYSASADACSSDELTTDEGHALLEDLAEFGSPAVLFSGGEPLLRPDLTDLVRRAGQLGLRAAVSTNGTLLSAERAAALREAGADYVGVSLDGLRATNDAFRGVDGAFARALDGIRHCRAAGLKVGLRFTMNRRNVGELSDIFELARQEGVQRLCFYHLVCTGRGADLVADGLEHAATRRAVDFIIGRTAEFHGRGVTMQVLTVDNHADGPYLWLRMRREGSPRAADVLRLLLVNGGNGSGIGIGCVSWDGTVHPDQFWRTVELGNVRRRPFSRIWADGTDPVLARLRDRRSHLKGRCAACRFVNACAGNLRARAEAITGDAWAPDPACYLAEDEISGEVEVLHEAD